MSFLSCTAWAPIRSWRGIHLPHQVATLELLGRSGVTGEGSGSWWWACKSLEQKLLTRKKYFSILTLVMLHQGRHLNFSPGICPVALGCLEETTIVNQLRVV